MIETTSFLSFDALKQDLIDYVRGQADAKQWVDFFESGPGLTMIEVMAGTGAMFNYRIDNIRKENYLPTARLKTSVYLIAQALGYNPLRKGRPVIDLKVNCPVTKFFNRFDPVGTIGGHTLSIDSAITVPGAVASEVTGVTATFNPDTGSGAFIEDTVNSPFISSGYRIGMTITTAGATTGGNNIQSVVVNVTDDRLYIEDDFAVQEAFAAGTSVNGEGAVTTRIVGNTNCVIRLAVAGNSAYLEDLVGKPFRSGNFTDGQTIILRNAATPANDGDYVVKSVSEDGSRLEIVGDFAANEAFQSSTWVVGGGVFPIRAIVGDWKTYTTQITASREFLVWKPGAVDYRVDDRYTEIQINGVPKNVVTERENFSTPDDVLVLTHYSGDIQVVFGDGIIGPLVQPNDQISLLVFETPGYVENLSVLAIAPASGIVVEAVDSLDVVGASHIQSLGTAEESLSRVRNLANRYYKALRRAVTLDDYTYFGKSAPGLIDCRFVEQNPHNVVLEASYIKGDQTLMTPLERAEFHAFMDQYRQAGVAIEIVDPVIREIDFKITAVIDPGVDPDQVKADMEQVINEATIQLNTSYLVGRVLKQWLTQITGIQRVYLVYPYEDRAVPYNEYFRLKSLTVTFVDDDQSLHAFDTTQGHGYV